MSHYLREHLDVVGELPEKLRETMASIGVLDSRVQAISEMIDNDVGEVARARQNYYAQVGSEHDMERHKNNTTTDNSSDDEEDDENKPGTKRSRKRPQRSRAINKGGQKSRPRTPSLDVAAEGPVPDGWRTPAIKDLEDQINSRVDLVLRMADEKWRLAQHAYDRLDVNIRRLDADLGRMETDLRRQGLLPPREVPAAPSRKRRRAGAAKTEEVESDWLGLGLSEEDDLPVHPNEPTYCICMQVSYGEMVGCDNPSCDNGEWFHFVCVKLTKRPPGKWLCPGCTAQRRQSRRGGAGVSDADVVTAW